ncbi:MAG: carboxypeptidase regulatory-like domain-containing protein [Candidatus Sulfotelmatobacter sp.]
MKVRNYLYLILVFFFLPWCAVLAASQTTVGQPASGILRGQLTDPSGAAIANANVVMTPAAISSKGIATQSNRQGLYEFKGLAPGLYTLTVVAQGFAVYENDNVVITTTQPLRLNVAMAIAVEQQKIQVSDTAPTIDVNPANNAGAITISGKELEALPDDPDELLTDLQALAGPSAGPNGGQIYIDGFTAGQLPPKASIREIRINQNPFSSEYDKLGYGRIEIFTKPGTDKFHGQLYVSGNDSAFNSPSPFGGAEPPYESTQFSGNVGGPLNKNASFFFNGERRNINEISPIDATTLDPDTFLPVQTLGAIPNPRQRTNISPRLDYQLGKNNTLTTRYQYYRDTETADGVGGFSLDSQAYNSKFTEQTLQVSDTQVVGAKIVNETRFQYLRDISSQSPLSTAPAISVPGGFAGGGSTGGTTGDHQDHYELQNYTSIIHGNHTIKFGGRLRAVHDVNSSNSGFNGTFTFSSLDGQTDTPSNCSIDLATSPNPNPPCPISYQYAQQQLQSGGIPYATQLSITTGTPAAAVTNVDAGLYVQDDWRLRPNITLSLGLRFETQDGIHDHDDWAPRLGFAWGVGGRSSPPKVVIRGGSGIFYDRFDEGQILQAERLNGVAQQEYIINNPTCFPTAAACSLSGAASTTSIYQISPVLHAPYTVESAVSVERQVTKSATLALTYLNSLGFDQFLSINANAPYPGTTERPDPNEGNVYQYVSEGNFKQNQLIANTNVRVGTKAQLFGYYVLNYANSDTSGVSSFASNSYNISQDYGRASFDTRERVFLGGSFGLPYDFRLSPFMIITSGSPFNITTADDLNGDSIFNDRPVFFSSATCPNPGTVTGTTYCTALGTFSATLPSAGQKLVPINYGTGPSHATLNLRLTKTIGFGPKTEGPHGAGPGGGHHHGPLFGSGPVHISTDTDHRYNLTLGVSARNVFNKVNLGNPSGILNATGTGAVSPFFDSPNGLQGGPFSTNSAVRRIDLQATFSF